jgi:hypothetical protein
VSIDKFATGKEFWYPLLSFSGGIGQIRMIITVENDGQPFLDGSSVKKAYIPQPEQTCKLLLNLSIDSPLFYSAHFYTTVLRRCLFLQISRVRTSHSGQIMPPVS